MYHKTWIVTTWSMIKEMCLPLMDSLDILMNSCVTLVNGVVLTVVNPHIIWYVIGFWTWNSVKNVNDTARHHYNMLQYIMILRTALQLKMQVIYQSVNSQETLYISSPVVSYAMALWYFGRKLTVITALDCPMFCQFSRRTALKVFCDWNPFD